MCLCRQTFRTTTYLLTVFDKNQPSSNISKKVSIPDCQNNLHLIELVNNRFCKAITRLLYIYFCTTKVFGGAITIDR